MSPLERANRLWAGAVEIPLVPYAIFSDLHRGVGNNNDNFLPNRHLFSAAAEHYGDLDTPIIELGDGFELWENRSLADIQALYCDPAEMRLRGNHDWSLSLPTALKIRLPDARYLFLTHGNIDWVNSDGWKWGRFMVRYLWRYVEMVGIKDPTSASGSRRRHAMVERTWHEWAASHPDIALTVIGHTHSDKLERSKRYANAGCGVNMGYVSNLELSYPTLTLVRWQCEAEDGIVKVTRRALNRMTIE